MTNKMSKDPNNKDVKFLSDSRLSEEKRKYCSCVLKAGSKQSPSCLTDKAWHDEREGKTCYNPYAICAASTKTSSRECGKYYDYDNLSDEYLMTYARLHEGILIPEPYNRDRMLNNIKEWKKMKESYGNMDIKTGEIIDMRQM